MTNYDKIMKEMTIEQMANLRVRMIIVNSAEPFYMTSTGQLFSYNNLNEAVKYEYRYLTTTLDQPVEYKDENSAPEQSSDDE